MYVLEYWHYFRGNIRRIGWAVFFMLFVGVFSAVNILAAIPVIKIIVNEMTYANYLEDKFSREVFREVRREFVEQHTIETTSGTITASLDDLLEAPAIREDFVAELKERSAALRKDLGPLQKWWREATRPIRERWDYYVESFYVFASKRENIGAALLLVSIAILIFTAIKAVSEYASKYLLSYTVFSAILRIKEDLFAHIMRQDAAFFSRHSTGFLESRINNDVKVLSKIFDALIRDAVQQPISIIALLSVLFYLSWEMTLIAIVVIPVAALPIAHFSRRLRKMTRKSQRQTDILFSFAEEALRNYPVVKVYDSEDYEIERFRKKNSKLFRYFLKQRVANFAQSPVMEFLGTIGAVGVILYGGWMVGEERLDGSEFIIYLVSVTAFYAPIRKLTKINVHWQAGRVSAERIREVLDMKSDVVEREGARPLDRVHREIRFENVGFRYDQIPILQNINLTIPLGKVVAIVGRSGAGKTSLVNLMPRMYDPTEGRILFDDVPADEFRLSDLRRLFGVVTQETILFNDTVAKNIAYAEADPIDMERVENAARLAFAHEFIQDLDGGAGYETVIGQGGCLLSGGQRQRLAIARAIYRDPQALIFDEATSALDEESQRKVQAAIDNLLKGRTAIVIAHRLSTVRDADIIVVMEKGRIIERGSHEELVEAKGAYYELYSQGEL